MLCSLIYFGRFESRNKVETNKHVSAHCPGWRPLEVRCSCWGSPRAQKAPRECRPAAWTAGWWCSQKAAPQDGCTCEPGWKHQSRVNVLIGDVSFRSNSEGYGLWMQSILSWWNQSLLLLPEAICCTFICLWKTCYDVSSIKVQQWSFQ